MAHSNQIREFILTEHGIELIPAYLGGGMVLTGSARLAQEARARAEMLNRKHDTEQRRKELERKRAEVDGQIALLTSQFAEEERLNRAILRDEERAQQLADDEEEMSIFRRITTENRRSVGAGGGS